MVTESLLLVSIIAFALTFFDAAVGMGYGTSIIPILILIGIDPLDAIPAVLLTNVVFGIAAGFAHHKFDNVKFTKKSRDLKVMLALSGFGVIGVVLATIVAVQVPKVYIEGYIGLLAAIVGAALIIHHKTKHKFSWKKIIGLGFFAAFNKGFTGGGYGPVVVGGQIFSGVKSTKAVGIASLAEGIVSIAGVLAYAYNSHFTKAQWALTGALVIGGITAVPIAAFIVNKYHPRKLRRIIGIVSLSLGTVIITQLFIASQ